MLRRPRTRPEPVRTDVAAPTSARRRRSVVPAAAVVAALLAVGAVTLQVSRAAFSSSTSNGPNSFSAGTVVLADDDSGAVMFNLSGMTPGTTATKCINVTYTGTVTSDVKLYGSVAGTGLATYLDTSIDVGTGAAGGAGLSCTGFSSSSNLYAGTLAAFGSSYTNYGNGLGGFAGATNPTTKSYRITVTLQNNNAAQGLTASSTFTWEAQNI